MSDGGNGSQEVYAHQSEITRLDLRLDERGRIVDRAVAEIVDREVRLGGRFSALERQLAGVHTATNEVRLYAAERFDTLERQAARNGRMLQMILGAMGIEEAA